MQLMPSAKHTSTMNTAMGLISSLLNVALSQDMPFRQPQSYALYKDHGLIFVLQFFSPTTQVFDLR